MLVKNTVLNSRSSSGKTTLCETLMCRLNCSMYLNLLRCKARMVGRLFTRIRLCASWYVEHWSHLNLLSEKCRSYFVKYSTLLNCNRAVTIRTLLDIPLMVAHLDRVFSVLPIAVTIRTVFLQEYPSWLNFLAVLGPCFFTSFHGGFTNKTVFLQQCPSWLLIGPCFYKKFMSGS